FDRELIPGQVHEGLAELERSMSGRGAPHQLVITTSFHELLEQAFGAAGCEFDVVSYLAVGRHQGKFLHSSADGAAVVVEAPYAYTDVSLEQELWRQRGIDILDVPLDDYIARLANRLEAEVQA